MARHFRTEGWYVVGLDQTPPHVELLADLSRYLRWSLPDPRLRDLLAELSPTVCAHCAGRASVPQSFEDPGADYRAGPPLVFELLDSLRLYSRATKFIFLSSAAVYGNPVALPVREIDPPAPVSPYGYHKWQAEQLCTEFAALYGLATANLRIFSAYGHGLRRQVVWDICYKLTHQDEPTLQGTGTETRDFIHAADVARAVYCLSASSIQPGQTYNLATGRETSIASLAATLSRLLSPCPQAQFDGVVPPGMPRNWRADISKIASLGFQPRIALEEGLAEVVTWYRQEERDTCRRHSASG